MDSEPTLFSDPVFNAVMIAAAVLSTIIAIYLNRHAFAPKKSKKE